MMKSRGHQGKYYHCAKVGTYAEISGESSVLCGMLIGWGIHWDLPGAFSYKNLDLIERCPDCLSHPDYPLLMLGASDD